MAVELRCPDCRAKLRLPEAPDAGTEVECPKCGTLFSAPEPEATDEDAPKKKKKPARDDADEADEKPKKGAKDKDDADDKKEKKEKKTKPKAADGAPKRRKAKKNETSQVALIAVVGAGLLMLICVSGVLIWFFTRTSKSVEMMSYLPEDCDTVQGLNLGHAQKYPEFYKNVSVAFKDKEFKAAGDTLAKTLGAADGDALMDYVVCGNAKSGSATVIRTKTEFDPGALAKLPGADPKTLGGKTYYLAPGFKDGRVRVFAPTNRLIVYCPAELSDAVFQKMLNGHADSRDKTPGVRSGELGKRVTRGTFWQFDLYDGALKPPTAPPPSTTGGGDDASSVFARSKAELLSGSKGMGMKASLGSREVRFEIVVWCTDSEKASSLSKKHKESELAKGDEGTPPRWWKEKVENVGKKFGAQMLANIGCGSAGELFYAKSSVETNDLKETVSSIAGKVTGSDPAAPPPPAPPPPKPRRRVWVRRGAERRRFGGSTAPRRVWACR